MTRTALVTGATNQIGYFLLPQLMQPHWSVIACSRQPPIVSQTTESASHPALHWQTVDLFTALPTLPDTPTVLFHLAPLPLLPELLGRLPTNSLQQVVAFSSTSRFTKQNSPEAQEQQVALSLIKAEQAVLEYCDQLAIPCTILRPTLIYGCGRDKNVSFIARFIQRFKFFPILEAGRGLRQPVHAADLATACLQLLDNPTVYGQSYNLTGGETLTYRAMVIAIFQHLQQKPRIITISRTTFTQMTRYANWLPGFRHVSTAMLLRMNQDLCFDASPAGRDFGYQARGFRDSELGLSK